MTIDLSIILPVINERENLRALIPRLREIAELFHLEYEIIVVDGGSSDGTRETAAELGARVVAECTHLQGLAATTIIYYLFSGTGALSSTAPTAITPRARAVWAVSRPGWPIAVPSSA